MKFDQSKIDAFKKESGAIVTIQELLRGRDPDFDAAKTIRLVRHLDSREKNIEGVVCTESLDILYRFYNVLFLKYQNEQKPRFFKNVEYIVSFLGEDQNRARFIGVYRIDYQRESPFKPDCILHEMTEIDAFKQLKDKVVIDWGDGIRSWVQKYETQIKSVVRIDDGFEDADGVPYFESYADTVLTFGQLKAIISSSEKDSPWFTALTSVNCIYLITDLANGRHYVGKTSGKLGIWQRWEEYVNTNGHGGNKSLEELISKDPVYAEKWFQWSILEVMPLNIPDHIADKRENKFKLKLRSRIPFGYNEN